MKLIDVTAKFNTDDKCLDYVEGMRWPNGVCCIRCGVMKVILGMVEPGGKLDSGQGCDSRDNRASAGTFDIIGKSGIFAGRRMINHTYAYTDGPNHTQTIQSAFSLLKRGIYGSYHKVSIKHLQRYCNESSFRFNRREEQLQMFGMTLKNLVNGSTLPYKKLV